VVVVNLAVEDPLGGVYDGFATGEHAVKGITRVVPKGKPDHLAAAVVSPEGVVVKGLILFRGTPKQVDLLGIEHTAGECVAFLPIFSESVWSEGSACHKGGGFSGTLAPHAGRHKGAAKPQPEKL
jgi:hypothetical protein